MTKNEGVIAPTIAAKGTDSQKPVADRVWMTGEWSHLFHEDGRQVERRCDLVFDLRTSKVVEMNVFRDNRWETASGIEREDVADSLVHANPEAIGNPEEHGFDAGSDRPSLIVAGWPEGSGVVA